MNLSDLVKDWGGFEKLVATLNETGDVAVEHNVVLEGRSGAPRQIDVLIRHKQGFYEHLVIAECKYWNSAVERIHVDALATTVREVGASRGVIFSTKGFQAGALTQAAHENIDLFKVRELTDEEWGLPGKIFDIYLHVIGISIGNFSVSNAFTLPGLAPSNTDIKISFGRDGEESATPIKADVPEKTLESLISRIARDQARSIYPVGFVKHSHGTDIDIRLRSRMSVNFTNPIAVSVGGGFVFIRKIEFDVGLEVLQSRIYFDRSQNLKFALAVEDCVRKSVSAASQKADGNKTEIYTISHSEKASSEDVVKNGSVLSVWIAGFQSFEKFQDVMYGEMCVIPSTSRP